MQKIYERVREIILSVRPDALDGGESALTLDSLDTVTIITEIDGELGVRIPPEEITPENFGSIESIARLIMKIEGDESGE